MAIVEQVAYRFLLGVDAVLTRKRHATAVTARGEIAYRLREELGWSQRRIGKLINLSQTRVRTLQSNHKALLDRFQARVNEEHRLFLQSPDALRLCELEEKLARLTGADIAEAMTERLQIPKRCAIVLAILAEAYPRPVSIEAMCELYDDACARLAYGFQRGADREVIRKNVSDLNRALLAEGWAQPVEIASAVGGRRLSDSAAARLSGSFGVPRTSKMMLAEERRTIGAEQRLVA